MPVSKKKLQRQQALASRLEKQSARKRKNEEIGKLELVFFFGTYFLGQI